MITLHDWATRIGNALAESSEEAKSRYSYLVFALEGLLATAYSIGLMLAVSLILGIFRETSLLLLFTGTLRMFAGGIHASTPTRCAIGGAIIFNAVAFGLQFIQPLSFIWMALAILMGGGVVLLSPQGTDGKPISSIQRGNLQRITLIIIIFDIIAFGFFPGVRQTVLASLGIILIFLGVEAAKGGEKCEEVIG